MLLELRPSDLHLKQDLESVRKVRNSVREYMTNNQDYISIEEQQDWFKNLDHRRVRVFLYYAPGSAGAVPAGYGIIRLIDDEPWLTGALLEKFRRFGHGRSLFRRLAYVALLNHDVVRLNAWETNERALRTYRSLGFKEYDRKDELIYMEKS